jgi:hypothetical protein
VSNILSRRFTSSQKLVLSAKSLTGLAEEVLGDELAAPKAPQTFPALPKQLEVTPSLRSALDRLPALFARIQPTSRRALDTGEVKEIGEELIAIREILTVLGQREDDIKEYFRNHQDVQAEHDGRAIREDVTIRGLVVQSATPRDPKGHYLLATAGEPEETEIPGTTARISNQFTSGKLSTDLEAITRAYEAGEIDRPTYLKVTVAKRVVDGEKLKAHALKTGDLSLLSRTVRRGASSAAMYVRGISKK